MIAELLRSYKFRFNNETELQDSIERLLLRKEVVFTREAVLNRTDRIDFLCHTNKEVLVGVEVKIKGALNDVLRQLARYAQSEYINSLILVTSRPQHQIPETLNGKPVSVIIVGGFI